jgi:hypothetical protein
VRRSYPGGRCLDELKGAASPPDCDGERPEDWIASLTRARNPGPVIGAEGLSSVRVDGRDVRKAALLCSVLMLLGSVVWFLPPMVARLLYSAHVDAMPLGKPSESPARSRV